MGVVGSRQWFDNRRALRGQALPYAGGGIMPAGTTRRQALLGAGGGVALVEASQKRALALLGGSTTLARATRDSCRLA